MAAEVPTEHSQDVVSSQLEDALVVLKQEGLAHTVIWENFKESWMKKKSMQHLVHEGRHLGLVVPVVVFDIVLVEDRVADQRSIGPFVLG